MQTDWADVYRRMYQDVVRFLYRKVWDADRAHDLAQETFVRCLRQEPDNPRALVFTVAANLARDEARTVLRRKKHLTLIRVEPQPQPATPAENAERVAQVESVQAALAALSDRDREVLLLWDAGLSYDEIAAQTGLAVGAIGTTLARARRRLVEAHEALEGQKHAAR
jgi:RNA polymerase sigma factor (sigma-70 family)